LTETFPIREDFIEGRGLIEVGFNKKLDLKQQRFLHKEGVFREKEGFN
jgi:hypothetical protein